MGYLCEPTTKRHQSRRAECIRRAYPDELLAIEVANNGRKCSSNCGLRMQRHALESEFFNKCCLLPRWWKKETHKLHGGEEDGKSEGKYDAPELPVLRYAMGGSDVFL